MEEIKTITNRKDAKAEYTTPEIQVIELEATQMILQTSDKRRYQRDFD